MMILLLEWYCELHMITFFMQIYFIFCRFISLIHLKNFWPIGLSNCNWQERNFVVSNIINSKQLFRTYILNCDLACSKIISEVPIGRNRALSRWIQLLIYCANEPVDSFFTNSFLFLFFWLMFISNFTLELNLSLIAFSVSQQRVQKISISSSLVPWPQKVWSCWRYFVHAYSSMVSFKYTQQTTETEIY